LESSVLSFLLPLRFLPNLAILKESNGTEWNPMAGTNRAQSIWNLLLEGVNGWALREGECIARARKLGSSGWIYWLLVCKASSRESFASL
jgi:hypothetical protein